MTSLIENFLRGIAASTLTEIFVSILLLVFVVALVFKLINKGLSFTNYAPTLLITIGIFGTFVGIVVGLLDFDTTDIDAGIGSLLEGLKTAFISSLMGMLLSILYQVIGLGIGVSKTSKEKSDSEISPSDFYEVMKKQADATELLRKSIAGDEDSSLVSLIKLQRQDATDRHRVIEKSLSNIDASLTHLLQEAKTQQESFAKFQEQLWAELQKFAEVLSESATKQVIEALQQVISDFNNKLTEQFGENFKELNSAVAKLVEWQENYKEQLTEMGQQYAQGVKAITATETSVAAISKDTQAIPETMTKLQTVMEVNQHQISELNRHLEAFKDIRDKTVEVVPEIRKQISEMLEGAKGANNELSKGITDALQEMGNALVSISGQFTEDYEKLMREMNKVINSR